jgi:hypothetical protein
MKTVSQRRTVGAVLQVPLGTVGACVALTLPEVDFAFFGPAAVEDAASPKLFSHPILFRVAVHRSAWSTGRWRKVAKLDVPSGLLEPQPKFMQDAFNPSKLALYVGGEIRPAGRAECEGLERMAVWDPEHVEQRLQDHLAGVPNVWVEQLRIK